MSKYRNLAELCRAIELEQEASREPIRFTVESVRREGALVQVFVRSDQTTRGGVLDERLEGARAWWAGEPNGSAEVFIADPEQSALTLRFADQPLTPGDRLLVFEPDFLEPLLSLWQHSAYQPRAYATLDREASESPPTRLVGIALTSLRPRQKEAVMLADQPVSLLHGPPGTGKTHTLAYLISDRMTADPDYRILLLAPTHSAVDEVLLRAAQVLKAAGYTGDDVKRAGSRFQASRYKGFEHLLPKRDPELVEKLARLEAKPPPKDNIAAYAAWSDQVAAVRAELRTSVKATIEQARCVGMTVASAMFNYELLAAQGWDLVVLDEASQVSAPAAMMAAALGKCTLFAGDPKQLAAVVRSNHPAAEQFMGATAFDLYRSAAEVRLDEQSRMVEGICSAVSKIFYGGELRVADDALADPGWAAARKPKRIGSETLPAVMIDPVVQASNWSQKYGGPIRYASAERVVHWASEFLKAGCQEDDILIVTPFRAQRQLIYRMLKHEGLRGIKVSTVHRAQGGERLIILFDVVDGNGALLEGEDGARLINVAVSRAKAHVVVFLGAADHNNKYLAQLARLAQSARRPAGKRAAGKRIQDFSGASDFPQNLVGERLVTPGVTGRVVSANEKKIEIDCEDTGKRKSLLLSVLLNNDV